MKYASLRGTCPFLPALKQDAEQEYDYRTLRKHGARRDADFYFSALCYGNQLWCQGHAGRALLALTRALYAELDGSEEILRDHPLPYQAMKWIVENHHSDDFPGNPRLSFQHQACRMREPRRARRSARAWAVWAIVCAVRPHLPGDSSLPECDQLTIQSELKSHGISGEVEIWENAMALK